MAKANSLRRMIIILALAIAAGAGLSLPVLARAPEHAEEWNAPAVAWQSIGDGIRESTRTGKPVIMVFHATWCPNCKRYREVFKDPAIVTASRDFVMILIDADKDKVANGAFAPDGAYVPRTLFLNAEGDVQSEIRGRTDPQYPHTIDASGPAELLSLMQQAKTLMIDAAAKPSTDPAGAPAANGSGSGAAATR